MRLTMSSRCQTFKHHIINLIEKEEKKKRKLQGLTKQGHMRMNTLTHENRGKDGGTAGSTRAFLGAAQASRKPAERKLWRTTEEKRSVTVRQHFVLPNARSPFSPRLPLFYSSRREAVYIALTHINSLSFRTEIPLDSLPTGFYYLGSDLSPTYLRYTIKCVPTCKGRFSCDKHSLRLGTVFFTTTGS